MRQLRVRTSAAALIRTRPWIAVAFSGVLVLAAGLSYWSFFRTPAPPPQPVGLRTQPQPAPRPTKAISFSDGCMTSRCHTALSHAPAIHAPVSAGACQSCHAPDSGDHKYPLLRPKAQLCSQCHTAHTNKQLAHIPINEDGCLACHDSHGGQTKALLIKNSDQGSCLDCHPRNSGSVHHTPYAAERCDLCHNIHSSDNRSLLHATNVVESCRTCHPQAVQTTLLTSYSHAKVEGDCLACHSPHASSTPGLLNEPLRDSCTRCHAQVGKTIAAATITHDPVLQGTQCIRCHEPHGSQFTGMLRSSEESLCLSCHDKSITTKDNRFIAAMAPRAADHSPAFSPHKNCSDCHDSHGSTHASLLSASNPKLPSGPYNRTNYALCYSCHDPLLADSPLATDFRDGDRNLHALHLKTGDQSRGCAACHAVHEENQPRQIAKSVRFQGSNWTISMGFSLTPDGGRCGSGCHEAMTYSRRPLAPASKQNGAAP